MPQWVIELQPSDWLMFAFLAMQLFFVLDYGIFSPWWRAPIGWIVFGYGISILLLMGLIVYGVVFGQRVDEWIRSIAMFLCLTFATGKEVILKMSRHQGRIERRARRRHEAATTQEGIAVSENIVKSLSLEEIKSATSIWYKGQRVLRSIVGALVVILPVANASALALSAYLAEQQDIVIPPVVFVWLNAVVAITALLIGGASRLMAVPGFNAWLTKWLNLGSVPRRELAVDQASLDVLPTEPAVYVMPDLKDKTRIGAEPSPIESSDDAR